MGVLVQDSFTDSNGTLLQNHTPEVGSAWAKISGIDATIQSNKLSIGGGTHALYYNDITILADVYAQLKRTTSYVNPMILIVRYGDPDWYVYFKEGVGLYEVTFGGHDLIQAYTTTLAIGETAKIEAVGSDLKLYYDDVLKASCTIPVAPTFGKVGLGYEGTNETFDDFEAGAAGAPPTSPTGFTATCTKKTKPLLDWFGWHEIT